MDELERLPEWAGRKVEAPPNADVWSEAERQQQPLVTLETEPEPVPTEVSVTDNRPLVEHQVPVVPSPRSYRLLVIFALLSLVAGLVAGFAYVTLSG